MTKVKDEVRKTTGKPAGSSIAADKQFGQLLKNNPAVLYICRVFDDHGITQMSENVRSLTGYDHKRFISAPDFRFRHIHPDDKQIVVDGMEKLLTDQHLAMEYRYRCRDGHYIWIRDEMTLTYDKDDRPIEISGHWTDITERKKLEMEVEQLKKHGGKTVTRRYAELISTNKKLMQENIDKLQALEILRKNEERLIEIQKYANLSSWDFDLITRQVRLSPDVYDTLGIKPVKPHPEAESFMNLIDPADWEKLKHDFYSSVSDNKPFDTDIKFTLPDGQSRWLNAKGFPVCNSAGKTMRMTGTAQDITERKLVEEALKKSEEKYRLAIEAGDVAVWTIDLSTGFVETDGKLEALMGYEKGQFGKEISFYEISHLEDREWANAAWDDLLSGKTERFEIEQRVLHKNGSIIWISVSAKQVWDEQKHIRVVAGTTRNITRRKLAEIALMESEERYRRISSTISDISYSCQDDSKGNYHVSWMTGAVKEIMGYTADEIMKMGCYKTLVIKEDIHLFLKCVTGLAPGETATGEFRLRRKNGDLAWIRAFTECIVYTERPGIKVLYGALIDITKEKAASEALRKSEQMYQSIFENSAIPIWEVDFSEIKNFYDEMEAAGVVDWREYFESHPESVIKCASLARILNFNSEVLRLFGSSSKEEMSTTISDYFSEDSFPVFREQIILFAEGGRRFEGETCMRDHNGDHRDIMINLAVPPENLDNLARVLVSFIDITARKQVEKAFQESELKYKTFFEHSAIPLMEEDFSGVKQYIDRLKAEGVSDWIKYFNEHPEAVGKIASLAKIINFNGEAMRFVGATSPEEVYGRFQHFFNEETWTVFRDQMVSLASGDLKYNGEVCLSSVTGEKLYMLIRLAVAPECHDTLSRVLVSFIDISERRRAEELLRKSEQRYQTIFEESAVSMWEEDASAVKKYFDEHRSRGVNDFRKFFDEHPEEVKKCASCIKVLDVNKECLKFYNAPAKDVLIKFLPESFIDESWPAFKESLIALSEGRNRHETEIFVKNFKGENKYLLMNLAVTDDSMTSLSRVLVSFIDITDRRSLEVALKKEEDRYRQLIENQGEGVGIVDLNEIFVFSNPAGDRIFGVQPGMLEGRDLKEFLLPEDQKIISKETAKRRRGQQSTYELRIINAAGDQRYLLVTATPQIDKEGRHAGTFGVFRDITERKRTEAALKESEDRYKSLVLGSPDIVYSFSELHGGTFYSPRVESILGHSTQEMLASPFLWRDSVHPEDVGYVVDAIGGFQQGKYYDLEYRIRHREGHWIWLRDRSVRLRDHNGEMIVDGLASDITDQKHAAEELKIIAERYKLATKATNDAIYDINLISGEVAFNETHIAKYGQMPESVNPWDWWASTIHPDDRRHVLEGMNAALNSNKNTWSCEYRILGVGNVFIDVHDQAYIMRNAEGVPVRLVGAFIDLTARKHAERELKMMAEQLRDLSLHNEAIREEERASIAMNLHDDLGQKLTALNMELSVLKGELATAAPSLQKKVQSMILSTKATISSLKKLSTQLRPSVLDDLGLAEACKWQAKEFSEQYNIRCDTYIYPPDIGVPQNLSVQIFRIVQEALTNIIRHASASETEISLTKEKKSLILKVKDNGIGISREKVNDPHSFGLLGMKERARSCGGGVLIKGDKGKGTEIVVEIPLADRDLN